MAQKVIPGNGSRMPHTTHEMIPRKEMTSSVDTGNKFVGKSVARPMGKMSSKRS